MGRFSRSLAVANSEEAGQDRFTTIRRGSGKTMSRADAMLLQRQFCQKSGHFSARMTLPTIAESGMLNRRVLGKTGGMTKDLE
ncbi:MAG: hypothetical protein H0Z34_07760 [Brevibacillus sp.]|nr:hypothetical protein [Brevibacillus sp.]